MAKGSRGPMNLTTEERRRRSFAASTRNAWVKEGSPGGKAGLADRMDNPDVQAKYYKSKGWEVPGDKAPQVKKPARPPGAPRSGPPQPPAPPAEVREVVEAGKDETDRAGADAFCILFPSLD